MSRPRWAKILTITGGSSMPGLSQSKGGDDLQCAATVRAVFDVNVEDPFEQPGRTHARRRALRVSVLGRMLCRTRNDFTTQLRVRREQAMEAGI